MWENETEHSSLDNKSKKDFLPHNFPKCEDNDTIILVQAAICAAIIIFILLTRAISAPMFYDLKEQYNALMSNGIDISGQGELVRFVDSFVSNISLQAQKLIGELDKPRLAKGGAQQGCAVSFSGTNAAYRISVTPLIPVEGTLSSVFGRRKSPITSKDEFHNGIDLAAPKGSKVFASYSGTVIKASSDKVRGNYIILQHNDNLLTLYQHLDKMYLKEGDSVLRGQIIGLVGKTGYATGYHLHYEIITSNMCVNPESALRLYR